MSVRILTTYPAIFTQLATTQLAGLNAFAIQDITAVVVFVTVSTANNLLARKTNCLWDDDFCQVINSKPKSPHAREQH